MIIETVEKHMSMQEMKERAKLFIDSGFMPPTIRTVEQAMTIILTGRALKLNDMESLRSINVIQGKPCLSAQLMLALCQRTGELEDMRVDERPGMCITTITRKGKTPYAYTFSMDDAKLLGLDQKDNWRKQAKTMLRWRSLSGNLRVTFADAICGIYTDDEAEDMIQDKIEKKAEVAEETHKKHEELTDARTMDPGNIHHSAEEIEFIQQVGGSFIQDTQFYKLYQDRTISEIYSDKTPAGKPKGKEYLQGVAFGSHIPEERARISRFLEILEREPAK